MVQPISSTQRHLTSSWYNECALYLIPLPSGVSGQNEKRKETEQGLSPDDIRSQMTSSCIRAMHCLNEIICNCTSCQSQYYPRFWTRLRPIQTFPSEIVQKYWRSCWENGKVKYLSRVNQTNWLTYQSKAEDGTRAWSKNSVSVRSVPAGWWWLEEDTEKMQYCGRILEDTEKENY